MNRQQKEVVVESIKQGLNQADATFLVNYQGLSVASMQALRAHLRATGSSLRVVKTRLMKIAAQDSEELGEFRSYFKNQTGLVFVPNDVAAAAKSIIDFTKKNDSLSVVAGFFEGNFVSKDQVTFIASLPSRDVLLAQVIGTMQAPISSFVQVLRVMLLKLLWTLDQIKHSKGV